VVEHENGVLHYAQAVMRNLLDVSYLQREFLDRAAYESNADVYAANVCAWLVIPIGQILLDWKLMRIKIRNKDTTTTTTRTCHTANIVIDVQENFCISKESVENCMRV
jgi:hypothetical protein